MQITMLGGSGVGKTCYMSAMSQLFYHGVVNGFHLKDRGNAENICFNHRTFDQINTIVIDNKWPSGTSSTTQMQLALEYKGNHVMDIDWIDYKGGLVETIDKGYSDEEAAKLEVILLTSDVILVFIDSIVLKSQNNIHKIRHLIGANAICDLLASILKRNKSSNVIFLLSKVGSDLINFKTDYKELLQKAKEAYTVFFTQINNKDDILLIPIDCVGFGNVSTQILEQDFKKKSYTTEIIGDIEPYNIDVSFAYALSKCIFKESIKNRYETEAIQKRIKDLEKNFGNIKQIVDILFKSSHRRLEIQEKNDEFIKHQSKFENLNIYKKELFQIWEGRI